MTDPKNIPEPDRELVVNQLSEPILFALSQYAIHMKAPLRRLMKTWLQDIFETLGQTGFKRGWVKGYEAALSHMRPPSGVFEMKDVTDQNDIPTQRIPPRPPNRRK